MQCKKCGSDNTQRLEVAYEHGTSLIDTRSHSVGGDNSGVLGVTTTTTGTSQTRLAKRAEPPEKKPLRFAAIGIGLSLLILNGGGSIGSLLFGLAMLAACAYYIHIASLYNNNEWPPLYKHWQECWVCHKCGDIFHRP